METARTFHNTIGLEGQELKQAEIQAGTQQGRILEYFKRDPTAWHTPDDVWDAVFPEPITGMRTPLQSIRRAITNLEKAGHLVKSYEAKVMGRYGKRTNQWALCHGQVQQTLF